MTRSPAARRRARGSATWWRGSAEGVARPSSAPVRRVMVTSPSHRDWNESRKRLPVSGPAPSVDDGGGCP
ncbi:MAG: hypothetical protein AVDCRST_MAG54-104 [uncultured Actinomycetospora sp.]|uniref:Uncharacterized protein n=1 Tax=uncultured Actinomycetospora sp. TaxID=1135996 RepID=A0A6J4H0R7_9PSEU|nr:MAG: hypothetical protein AVDCRST_MAG54-104 [uncultured Actinomycetospora sp.]